ncbi:MAG: DNA gyrase inhibitor YacG [Bdellovibrio sp. CG10_big_fil_rev_8_21_14_0_10_47_8]|nr:MAG: DNA gyrase inhibitor YacG [Bdellovibrio sp. CG10_big_fil_rev_8_21_14_0_10_47_8]
MSKENFPVRKVKCPHCGADSIYAPTNPTRPFCSERCRLMDLGEWASGGYAIPSEENASIQDLPSNTDDDQDA